jgi:hypothetical protein
MKMRLFDLPRYDSADTCDFQMAIFTTLFNRLACLAGPMTLCDRAEPLPLTTKKQRAHSSRAAPLSEHSVRVAVAGYGGTVQVVGYDLAQNK